MVVRRIDLTGKQFGYWTVLRFSHVGDKWVAYWEVKCVCGTIKTVKSGSLFYGKSKSCGCYRDKRAIETHTKHGGCGTTEYSSWIHMKARCLDKKHKHYKRYGGRGITICKKWVNSFETFIKDMGIPPTSKHTLERLNSNKNYIPSNCIWATRKEQSRNTSQNRYYIYKGKKRCVAEIAEIMQVKETVLRTRLNQGWDLKVALETPIQTVGKGFKKE